jgi:hypothetical protein
MNDRAPVARATCQRTRTLLEPAAVQATKGGNDPDSIIPANPRTEPDFCCGATCLVNFDHPLRPLLLDTGSMQFYGRRKAERVAKTTGRANLACVRFLMMASGFIEETDLSQQSSPAGQD